MANLEHVAIVSREVASTNYAGEPNLWRVIFDDGQKTWPAHLTKESLRRYEIEYQLQESGINMDLVNELIDIVYLEGKESEWTDD